MPDKETEMNIEKEMHQRSGSKCELCTSSDHLKVYEVPPTSKGNEDNSLLNLPEIKIPFTFNEGLYVVSIETNEGKQSFKIMKNN